MKNGPCPKCGSTEIIPNVEIRDQDAHSHRRLSVFVKVTKTTGGMPYKGSESSELQAWICGKCGYTEIYAVSFRKLREARRKE
ncbi:MAG: hypothetical protein L0332_12405 [Chloroflexi bacterium]|nr:hypothetical protein [Chloroflexota bacterium]MCI0574885.1 hypothetical protein [Chloroflexota bacterium]MCI0648387.1 hypothetical protein [Chloroflexota bacterium]MCI0727508.1 hypothetical protein [Chloroflexota bacterium]